VICRKEEEMDGRGCLNEDAHSEMKRKEPSPASGAQLTPIDAPVSTHFPIRSNGETQDGTIPSLPPQMASVRSYNTDEIIQLMSKTPLFMTSLDDGADGMLPHDLRQKTSLSYDAS